MKKRLLNKKTILIFLFLFASIVSILVLNLGKPTISQSQSSNFSQQLTIQPPITQTKISQEFVFPINNGSGEKIGQFKYIVDTVELRNQIIVKGNKLTAVKGRTFLIINLKIQNDMNKNIQINTRDYIRLIVNDNTKEKIAPDMHNDPIESQAISTKYTRIGFVVNENDKNLKLQIGEINNENKKTIDLPFK